MINSKKIIFSTIAGLGLVTGAFTNANTVQASATHTPKTYTVKSGDCFWSIAKKYKMTVKHLCAINGKSENSIIYPKDKLKLKGKEKPVVEYTAEEQVQEPVVTVVAEQSQQAPVSERNTNTYVETGSGESSAKEWIAQRESGGSYNAQNYRYIGRYQLDSTYLNGDYSPANQERVANQYVKSRYGSWSAAQAFWQAHGWY